MRKIIENFGRDLRKELTPFIEERYGKSYIKDSRLEGVILSISHSAENLLRNIREKLSEDGVTATNFQDKFNKLFYEDNNMETMSTSPNGLTIEQRLVNLEKDLRENGERVIRIAKDNWPLELIQHRPFTNFMRKLLLTKYKTTYKEWREKGGCPISFN